VSVPANIAEGFGRRAEKELLRFCRISDGSLQEAKYLLRLAADLGYYDADRYDVLRKKADRVGALLGGLTRHLNESVRRNSIGRING
jgi:four helix bundle protein